LLSTIRQFCLVSLPLLLVAAITFKYLLNDKLVGYEHWAEYFYIISLTANIGYFTNFIAIKMLFKPYQATAFGRQGLIPKNQDKLASALATTLNDHFLTSEHWLEYLQQANIPSKLTRQGEVFCQQWVEDPNNVDSLIELISNYLERNESKLHPLFEQFQSQVVVEISSELDIDDLLNQGFDWVEKQFIENPQKMEFMIEPLIKTLAENIPMIAERLVTAVDQHIENQGTIKRSLAKAALWSSDISQQDIQHYLFRMVASAEFRLTLFEGLQSLLTEYKNRCGNISTEEPSFDLQGIIQELINSQTSSICLSKIIALNMQKPENKKLLSSYIKTSINPIFVWIQSRVNNTQFSEWVNQQIIELVETVDLKNVLESKARKFSPRQMESLFQSMISEQLVFIELFGALLGALSGLALINLSLFVYLSVFMLALYLSDYFFTQKREHKIALDKNTNALF